MFQSALDDNICFSLYMFLFRGWDTGGAVYKGWEHGSRSECENEGFDADDRRRSFQNDEVENSKIQILFQNRQMTNSSLRSSFFPPIYVHFELFYEPFALGLPLDNL